MFSSFGIVLLFLIAAMLFTSLFFGVSSLLRPHKPNEEKLTTYESGEDPLGNANIQFNVRFYIVALIFILFEVELIFLFPWATVFGNAQLIKETHGLWGWFALGEMMLFVAILALGLVFVWAKGYLDWVKPEQRTPDFISKIPMELYKKVNEKYSK